MAACENIMVDKVVADQDFICINTINTANPGQFPPGATVVAIAFTRIQVDCNLDFDTTTNQVNINMTFTLDADVTITPPLQVVPVSDIQVTCSGTFCGVSATMFTAADQALIECELVKVISITNSNSIIDPNTGTLTTTITIISKFALLMEKILTVSLCPGQNGAEIDIPYTPCRCDLREIIEELKEIIRQEMKSQG